jgi:hypothetical protein
LPPEEPKPPRQEREPRRGDGSRVGLRPVRGGGRLAGRQRAAMLREQARRERPAAGSRDGGRA